MPSFTPLTAEWQFIAELSVDDRPVAGDWDAIDGGDTTSKTRTYRPGGRFEPQTVPAVRETTEVSLERAYRGTVDGAIRKMLAGSIGMPAKVTVFAIDDARNEVPGTRETLSGIVKEVTRPAFRSEADGVALYRVVVAPNGHWK